MVRRPTRAQLAMMQKPTRRAVQQALAAQAPHGWIPAPRERKRAAKITEEAIPAMVDEDDDALP